MFDSKGLNKFLAFRQLRDSSVRTPPLESRSLSHRLALHREIVVVEYKIWPNHRRQYLSKLDRSLAIFAELNALTKNGFSFQVAVSSGIYLSQSS